MKTRLIIHIGSPKTGTTALQNYFARHREQLQTQYGIVYPEAGTPAGLNGHHNLIYEKTWPQKYVAARGGFNEIQSLIRRDSPRIVVLSAEGFFMRSSALSEWFSNLGDLEIDVVLYLRRQDQYLESGYNQLARMARVQEYPEAFFFRRNHLYRFRDRVSGISNGFKGARLIVLPFDKGLHGGDIVVDFFKKVLDIDLGATGEKETNTRMGLKVIQGVYQLQREISFRSGKVMPLGMKSISRIQKMLGGNDFYDYCFVSPLLSKTILAYCKEDNEWLSREYTKNAGGTFFSSDSSSHKKRVAHLDETDLLNTDEINGIIRLAREIVPRRRQGIYDKDVLRESDVPE